MSFFVCFGFSVVTCLMGNGSLSNGADVGLVTGAESVSSGCGGFVLSIRLVGGALIEAWLNSIELAAGLNSTSPRFWSLAAIKFFLNLGASSLLDAT